MALFTNGIILNIEDHDQVTRTRGDLKERSYAIIESSASLVTYNRLAATRATFGSIKPLVGRHN